ncbi:MAG: GAF domain-containing protein [Proteobacteria bacterium]|nr:GAF domain-containing protein [Pseudomonadota bacterium]
MARSKRDEPIPDLSDCDREPIHVPGTIQSFGMLLACRTSDWVVEHVSANAGFGPHLGATALGKNLKDVVGQDIFHALTNALAGSPSPELPGRLYQLEFPGGVSCNASIHAYQGVAIVEFEPQPQGSSPVASLAVIRSMLTRMQQALTVGDVCELAVRQLRSLVDFDRVMVYRFLEDGSGSVVSEARGDDVPSFLGHHYPASDIPRQARQLYLKNWLRLIADVNATPVPVLSKATSTPLDMTYCGLRSVSPIHIQYLKNMDLEASLSISIVVGGSLWGLFACHNRFPRIVPPDTRLAAEFFGQAFSLQLQTLARADVAEMLRDARRRIDYIVAGLAPGIPLQESLGPRLADLQGIVSCDGAALWLNGYLSVAGSCPPDDEIPRIADAISGIDHSGVFATHQLSRLHPPAAVYAARASGVLSVPLSKTPGHYLLLFRKEFIRTIDWAGNPEKPVGLEGSAPVLSPRKSFEIWREEVKHQSRMWEPHDRLTGEALRIALLEIVLKYNEIVAQERARADRAQKLQTAEFNHRVKNALALVGALVAQSRERTDDVSSFSADLEGRIRALATAHDLASRPGKLELGQLLEIELKPYGDDRGRIAIFGPTVRLGENAASVLALTIHEMVTNACKHGALSVPTGRINVAWHIDASGTCVIEWREAGAPRASTAPRTGFGLLLIERQLPFELGGITDVRFGDSGVSIDLRLPPASFEFGSIEDSTNASREDPSTCLLAGRRVLLVEDNFVVGLEIERQLRRLGAAEVYLLGNLAQALDCARTQKIDVALLDVNLKSASSYAVADLLAGRAIPFAFATGYGLDVLRPPEFAAVPLIAKPFSDQSLAEILGRCLASPPVRG